MTVLRRGLVAAALLSVAACSACREAPPPAPLPRSAAELRPLPADVGERAWRQIAELVGFGARHTGTPGLDRALQLIERELRECGLEPTRDHWVDEQEGLPFTNVAAHIEGGRPDRIVIACHHDTKITSGHADPDHNFHFVGANDSGSGVGLLLELARELAATPPTDCSVDVVFFDGEESVPFTWDPTRALFGSRRYVAQHLADPDAQPIRAMLLLDMVGARDLTLDDELLSTPELKDIILVTAARLGHDRYLFHNRLDVRDDHKPFLDAGIPAVDLIDIADNPQWHTPADTLEHVSAHSLQVVGEIVWNALPAIAARYVPGAGE